MELITIYHGSQEIVDAPKLELCRPHNDYGQGFYCTQDLELAKEWACQKQTDGFVNTYSLSVQSLKTVDLNSEEYTVLHWLEVLFENRFFNLTTPIMKQGAQWLKQNYSSNLEDADIIQGYRADDSYFGYARAFLSNSITLDQLNRALYLGDLGTQVMVKSKKAFSQLDFVEYEKILGADYFPKYEMRDVQARKDFAMILHTNENESNAPIHEQLYLSTLMTMDEDERNACLQQKLPS